MHPPFGFALFYLRSVAPKKDYVDKVTSRLMPKVSTGEIYWGAVPFVCIQIVMVVLVIMFPGMVLDSVGAKSTIDSGNIQIDIPAPDFTTPGNDFFNGGGEPPPPPDFGGGSGR
jgi:hypothetical protein